MYSSGLMIPDHARSSGSVHQPGNGTIVAMLNTANNELLAAALVGYQHQLGMRL